MTRRTLNLRSAAVPRAFRHVASLRALLALVVLAVALLGGIAAPARAGSDGYVSTDLLKIRSQPSSSGTVLAKMPQGSYVAVHWGPDANGWYEITYKGIDGWAWGGYLTVNGSLGWSGAAPSTGSSASFSGTAWVTTDSLNVRSRPGTGSAILGKLKTNAEIWVTGAKTSGFYPISYGGGTGYVSGDYISFSGPAASTASSEKWIDVDRGDGTVTLYIGNEVYASYYASMGYDGSDDGFYATAIGTYEVYGKHAPLIWTNYGQGYFKYWVAFDPARKNGFHSYLLDANAKMLKWGAGPTGGCVSVKVAYAKVIYDFADYGTRVEVHW